MSQADELLNSLTDDQIALYSANSDTEPHIIIGDDRYITVPDELKRIAVQFDHNVETVTFDCPRYWDNLDMSEMIVYINYLLPNGIRGAYIAENIKADGDIMHFTWTITNNITTTKGNVSFLVCIKKTNADGDEVNHWNSELNRDMYISEGLECQPLALEEYPDIITQLLERMTVNEGYYSEIQELTTTATTAANTAVDAEEAATTANEQVQASASEIRNSYANAIKGNVSGEIIRVDDVSPIKHTVIAKVGGKNRFNIAKYHTEKDYSNGQTIYAIDASNLVIGKTYTVSSTIPMQWFKISNSATGYSCVGLANDTTGFFSYTFTHNRNVNIKEEDPLYIYVNNLEKTAMYDLSIMETMEICIVEGSIASTYEPFVDPSSVTVTTCGRNIFKPGTVEDYEDVGNLSISVGGDISNTVTSSNSSHAVNINRKYPPGTYAIAFIYSDSSPRTLIRVYDKNGTELTECGTLTSNGFQYNSAYKGFFKNGSAHTITIPEDVSYWCMGFVFPVTTTAPVGTTTTVRYAQIQHATDTSDFEVYNGTEYTPDADGNVIIEAIEPIMTIFTDTPDMSIDIEYNRDTTKMFESYVLTDKAKNEIAGIVEDDMAEVLASLNEYAVSVAGGDS